MRNLGRRVGAWWGGGGPPWSPGQGRKGRYLVSSIEARAGNSPLSLVVAGLCLNSHTYPSVDSPGFS